MNNILYDTANKRLAALVDSAWSCATHLAHDFFTEYGGGATLSLLKAAIATGPVCRLDERLLEDEENQSHMAEIWDTLLAERGAIRSSTVASIERLDNPREFVKSLAPFMLCNEFFAKRRPEDVMDSLRADSESKIVAFLEKNYY